MAKSQSTVEIDGATDEDVGQDDDEESSTQARHGRQSAHMFSLLENDSTPVTHSGALEKSESTKSPIRPDAKTHAEGVGANESNPDALSNEVVEALGSIVPSLHTDEEESDIGKPVDIETLRSFETQAVASRLIKSVGAPDRAHQRTENGSQSHDAVTEMIYPQVLEDDFARLRTVAKRVRMRKGFATPSIVLLGFLVSQYTWFMPADLAKRYPQTRYLLDAFFRLSACRLPEQSDLSQIKVLSRDVRIHPIYEGALLVSAQLVNVAKFVQPYPTMQFTLFNVNGQTITTRTFRPREYIDPSVEMGAGMVPTVPTQIELDMLVPDEAAVSFEFRFL